MVFGSHCRLRNERGHEWNNDHHQNCISHCHLLGTRDSWQLRRSHTLRRYVEPSFLLSIQTLNQQQLPLAEFLALEPF
jgi:hypothetical protein